MDETLPNYVLHVSQSAAAEKMRTGETTEGGEEKNDEDASDLLLCWSVDWRDGFGPNRSKNFRNSVLLWTWTIAPPRKGKTDAKNTLPMALGVKGNTGFKSVERRFHDDMEALCCSKDPIYVYSGKLRKIIPVRIKLIATLADKPERADMTCTLAYNSKIHRCFGKILQIEQPKLDVRLVKQWLSLSFNETGLDALPIPYLKDKIPATEYGWSRKFVSPTVNGGKLQSCSKCRDFFCRSWE